MRNVNGKGSPSKSGRDESPPRRPDAERKFGPQTLVHGPQTPVRLRSRTAAQNSGPRVPDRVTPSTPALTPRRLTAGGDNPQVQAPPTPRVNPFDQLLVRQAWRARVQESFASYSNAVNDLCSTRANKELTDVEQLAGAAAEYRLYRAIREEPGMPELPSHDDHNNAAIAVQKRLNDKLEQLLLQQLNPDELQSVADSLRDLPAAGRHVATVKERLEPWSPASLQGPSRNAPVDRESEKAAIARAKEELVDAKEQFTRGVIKLELLFTDVPPHSGVLQRSEFDYLIVLKTQLERYENAHQALARFDSLKEEIATHQDQVDPFKDKFVALLPRLTVIFERAGLDEPELKDLSGLLRTFDPQSAIAGRVDKFRLALLTERCAAEFESGVEKLEMLFDPRTIPPHPGVLRRSDFDDLLVLKSQLARYERACKEFSNLPGMNHAMPLHRGEVDSSKGKLVALLPKLFVNFTGKGWDPFELEDLSAALSAFGAAPEIVGHVDDVVRSRRRQDERSPMRAARPIPRARPAQPVQALQPVQSPRKIFIDPDAEPRGQPVASVRPPVNGMELHTPRTPFSIDDPHVIRKTERTRARISKQLDVLGHDGTTTDKLILSARLLHTVSEAKPKEFRDLVTELLRQWPADKRRQLAFNLNRVADADVSSEARPYVRAVRDACAICLMEEVAHDNDVPPPPADDDA